MWYRRHECGLRMAIFFSAATAAGAFGGLLARGIMEMRGTAGLSGWQWIFILVSPNPRCSCPFLAVSRGAWLTLLDRRAS
jgi:hypothetical protein